MPSRRRRIEKNTEIQKPGAAVNQKINAEALNRPVDAAKIKNGWGGSQLMPDGLVGPKIQCDATPDVGDQTAVDLHLPDRLDPSMRAGVLATIAQASPDLRQAFLDELAGHLAIPSKTIHNPIGWLHSLIRRYRDGDVVLAMAPQVSEQRQRRQRHLERMNAGSEVAPHADLPSVLPEPAKAESEVQRNERQRLKELRASFQAPVKQGGSL